MPLDSDHLNPFDESLDKVADEGQDKHPCPDQRAQRHIDLEKPDAHGADDGPSNCCSEQLQNELTHLSPPPYLL